MKTMCSYEYVKEMFLKEFSCEANMPGGELYDLLTWDAEFEIPKKIVTYNVWGEGPYEEEEEEEVSYIRIDNIIVQSLVYESQDSEKGTVISGVAEVEYKLMPMQRVKTDFPDDYEDFEMLEEPIPEEATIRFSLREAGCGQAFGVFERLSDYPVD